MIYLGLLVLVAIVVGSVLLALMDPDFGLRFEAPSETLQFWKDRIPLKLDDDDE